MIRSRALFVGLVCAFGIGASAQMPSMPSLWYNPALLMIPAVQKDLNVSPEVAQKATQAMIKEAMKSGPAVSGLMAGKTPTSEQMKEATAALKRMQDAATKDLSPAQKARLHEITLQSYGAKALLDPKVAEQVGLTATQASNLKSAVGRVEQSEKTAYKASSSGKGFDMSAMQSAAEVRRKQTDAALNSILNPKQKQKWLSLQGKQIDLGPLGAMMGG